MENFSELIKNRRSMRKFTDEELTQDEVVALMKAALMSPSSKRSNSWQFVVVDDKEMLKELEHQHLQSELQYLKYQINPHFFMNTLNNIHALVDIDTGKAKSTIVELSKLMRYVLYEASNKTILLSREIQFLENYVTLMSLR